MFHHGQHNDMLLLMVLLFDTGKPDSIIFTLPDQLRQAVSENQFKRKFKKITLEILILQYV